jgi:biopolymer transport protein ExbB
MDLYRMSLWQLFLAGGVLMLPIFLCSVFALAIVYEKLWYLRRIKIDLQDVLSSILERIKRNDIKEALSICDKAAVPLTRVLKAGILKYDRSRTQIKEAMEDASLYELPQLEKNLSLLATIAHICPLLGFLGTVTGLIRCFQVVQARQAAMLAVTAADLASGMWEALIATAAGLLVAIPAFIAYNYLITRVNNYISQMEKASTELVNFLAE